MLQQTRDNKDNKQDMELPKFSQGVLCLQVQIPSQMSQWSCLLLVFLEGELTKRSHPGGRPCRAVWQSGYDGGARARGTRL